MKISEQPTTWPQFPEIPYSEYKSRIEKIKISMDKENIDALILFDIDNIRYYTGNVKASYGFSYGWRRGIIIPKEGDVIFIASPDTFKNAKITTWVYDLRPWGSLGIGQNACQKEHEVLFIQAIKEINAKTVGAELAHYMKPEISYREFLRIKDGLEGTKFVDCSSIIMQQRQIKSMYEQNIIRELVQKVCKVVEKSIHGFKPGMTERDLHKMLWLGFINEGIHEDPMAGRFMMSGPGRYDVFNMGPTDTPLKMGDTLLIDGGPRYKGYFCDIQRNICIGMPTDEIKRIHKMSLIGQEAALNAVRPGAKASDIYFAAKRALKKLDPKNEMLGDAGHGIGLYSHELPVLDAETETEIKPGMCLAVEVAAFDHGRDSPRFCSMMPEDNIIVTESGYENLSGHLSKELWLVK